MSIYIVSANTDTLQFGELDTVSSILQNIRVLLSTPKGSVPLYRDFGVDMDFVDLPLPAAEQRARVALKESIEQWESRVTVKSISFSRADGTLVPTVEVEIINE